MRVLFNLFYFFGHWWLFLELDDVFYIFERLNGSVSFSFRIKKEMMFVVTLLIQLVK